MKVSELTGSALDWAVAKSMGFRLHTDALLDEFVRRGIWLQGFYTHDANAWLPLIFYRPSFEWAQGGRIIDTLIEDGYIIQKADWGLGIKCFKVSGDTIHFSYGPTLLIAAMRCLVASKLGNEIELPEELK